MIRRPQSLLLALPKQEAEEFSSLPSPDHREVLCREKRIVLV